MRVSLRIPVFSLSPFIVFAPAFAQTVGSAPATGSSGSVPLWSALIGAVSALAVTLFKDYIVPIITERRTKQLNEKKVYRLYLAPLYFSCVKLNWRFKEILIDDRHQFLLSTTLPIDYNQYKRISTLYRIGSVLGWIRAMTLELDTLSRARFDTNLPIGEQISALHSALADGPHVELHRLEQFSSALNINLKEYPSSGKRKLAAKFEVQLYNLAGEDLKQNPSHLHDIDDQRKADLSTKLANFLCDYINQKKIDEKVVYESRHRAIDSLSYREALIYRDWQDAISDSMLERDPDSERRFKIISYRNFEDILAIDTPWMRVFAKSIVDINFDEIDPNDFRSKQLREIAKAVSNIILAIASSQDADLVSKESKELAQELMRIS